MLFKTFHAFSNRSNLINGQRPTGTGGLPPGFVGGFSSTDVGSGQGDYGAGYGGSYGSEADEDLSIEPDEMETVRQRESKYMGANPYQMLDTDPDQWIAVADLPEIIPLQPNSGSDVGGFSSNHSGGANFLLGDGSVHFLSNSMDRNTLQQLGNRADKTLTQINF